jgi:hypothetical protein
MNTFLYGGERRVNAVLPSIWPVLARVTWLALLFQQRQYFAYINI